MYLLNNLGESISSTQVDVRRYAQEPEFIRLELNAPHNIEKILKYRFIRVLGYWVAQLLGGAIANQTKYDPLDDLEVTALDKK